MYIVGIVVEYALPSSEISDKLSRTEAHGQVRVRSILQAVVCDHPARCDCMKVKRGGHHACGNCLKRALLTAAGQLAYGGARQDVRDGGCEKRTVENFLAAGEEHLLAVGKKGERDAIAARTGYTGFCFLVILVGVFGFDPVRDNVGDWMHKGPENLVKNFLSDTLWNPKKHPVNLALPPNERSPLNGPFIPRATFGAQMSRFVWPRTQSAGRLPADPETKSLGYWKAEEHMKAGNFVFEAAFYGLIDEEGFAIATLVAKIMQIVYVIGARDGWTEALRGVFAKLAAALAVRSEEYFGPKLRQLHHEICFHPLDDLLRHGSPDALWCWLMERYIKVLGGLTKNGKQIETTMTIKVLLGLISSFLDDRRREQQLLKARKLPGDADWATAREAYEGGLVIVGSQGCENCGGVADSTEVGRWGE